MHLLSVVVFAGLAIAQAPITPPSGVQVNEIPILGLGTWYMNRNASQAISAGIQGGYRHLDCAWVYFNQEEIAPGIREGIRRANITRKDLWVTSKLWNSQSVHR
jgi:alcohol dehydrogenase (NADP+)